LKNQQVSATTWVPQNPKNSKLWRPWWTSSETRTRPLTAGTLSSPLTSASSQPCPTRIPRVTTRPSPKIQTGLALSRSTLPSLPPGLASDPSSCSLPLGPPCTVGAGTAPTKSGNGGTTSCYRSSPIGPMVGTDLPTPRMRPQSWEDRHRQYPGHTGQGPQWAGRPYLCQHPTRSCLSFPACSQPREPCTRQATVPQMPLPLPQGSSGHPGSRLSRRSSPGSSVRPGPHRRGPDPERQVRLQPLAEPELPSDQGMNTKDKSGPVFRPAHSVRDFNRSSCSVAGSIYNTKVHF
jgi:hypothetical protein